MLFIYWIISALLFSDAKSQSTLEIKLKCSQPFRMQIFYTGPEITKKWSEKFTTFNKTPQSDDFVKYRINLKTSKKIDNIRIDFGEIPLNEIAIVSIKFENDGNVHFWNTERIFDEFNINQELILLSLTDSALVLKTRTEGGKFLDPYIHLPTNNNRLVKDPRFFSKITIHLKGNKNNKINGTFWLEDQQPISVSKNYSPAIEKLTFKIFGKGKLYKAAFNLGQGYDSEYDISSFAYESHLFNRTLVGSEILKYFQFNFYTKTSGKEILHVDTRIYDGRFEPGFSSTKELISLKEEITRLVIKILSILFVAIFCYYANSYIFGRNPQWF